MLLITLSKRLDDAGHSTRDDEEENTSKRFKAAPAAPPAPPAPVCPAMHGATLSVGTKTSVGQDRTPVAPQRALVNIGGNNLSMIRLFKLQFLVT